MLCGIYDSLEYSSEGGVHVAVDVKEVLPCLSFPFLRFFVRVGDGGPRHNKIFPYVC